MASTIESPDASPAVAVDITDASSTQDPPATRLTYRVRNETGATIWLVDDGFLAWRQDGRLIVLDFSRVPMRPGVQPFGYFNPRVVAVESRDEVSREVSLDWPLDLSGLWNADDVVAPAPGRYDVVVRVGYGESPEPPPVEDLSQSVEAPVLAWQRVAESEPAGVDVPASD
jgi:hypothetical protein